MELHLSRLPKLCTKRSGSLTPQAKELKVMGHTPVRTQSRPAWMKTEILNQPRDEKNLAEVRVRMGSLLAGCESQLCIGGAEQSSKV